MAKGLNSTFPAAKKNYEPAFLIAGIYTEKMESKCSSVLTMR
jgi:hypothetical protein